MRFHSSEKLRFLSYLQKQKVRKRYETLFGKCVLSNFRLSQRGERGLPPGRAVRRRPSVRERQRRDAAALPLQEDRPRVLVTPHGAEGAGVPPEVRTFLAQSRQGQT